MNRRPLSQPSNLALGAFVVLFALACFAYGSAMLLFAAIGKGWL
jgi:hypothetical protein